jgi:hypothetical protein
MHLLISKVKPPQKIRYTENPYLGSFVMKQFGKRKNEGNKTYLNTKSLRLWKQNLDKRYVAALTNVILDKRYVAALTNMNFPLFAWNSYD